MAGALLAVGGFLATYGSAILTVASIGAQIALTFLTPRPKSEGPRLGDLRVQTSTYGTPIPNAYGRVRLAGNVIWATEIIEKKKTATIGGGLFGGGTQTRTYTYFANVAIAFAANEATGITRIWANKQIILDRTGASATVKKYEQSPLRVFLGTETQVPDLLIEANEGTGNVPAYRGIAYIVFELLPLQNYGNSIPTIEAEWQFKTPGTTSSISVETELPYAFTDSRVQTNTFQMFLIDRTGPVTAPGTGRFIRYNLLTQVEEIAPTKFENLSFGDFVGGINGLNMLSGAVMAGPDNRVFVHGIDTGNGNAYTVLEINPFTGDIVGASDLTANIGGLGRQVPRGTHTWTKTSDFGTEIFSVLVFDGDTFPSETDANAWVIINHRLADWGSSNLSGLIKIARSDTRGIQFVRDSTSDDDGNLWLIGHYDDETSGGVAGDRFGVLWKVEPLTDPDTTTGSTVFTVTEYDLIDLDSAGQGPHDPRLIVYDSVTNTLTIWGTSAPSGADSGFARIVQFDIDTKTYINTLSTNDADIWQLSFETVFASGAPTPTMPYTKGGTDEEGRIPLYGGSTVSNTTGWILYDAVLFTFTEEEPGPDLSGTVSQNVWHQALDDLYQFEGIGIENSGDDNTRFRRTILGGAADTLGLILTALTDEVGLNGLISTDAAIDAQLVDGYIVARPGVVRDAIEPLAFTYLFDGVESDGLLKFISRGNASIRTIQEVDLGTASGNKGEANEKLLTTRAMEIEIPERIDVRYIDFNRDYQDGTQHAKRMEFPSATQFSRAKIDQNLPIVMDADTAKRAAEAQLFNAWIQRNNYEWSLGPKHMDLDPTDVVTVVDANENIEMRLSSTELGEAFVSKMRAGSNDGNVYTVLSDGVEVAVPEDTLGVPGPTNMFLMDIALLRDEDSLGQEQFGIRVGMSGQLPDWTSGLIFRSDNPFEPWDVFEVGSGIVAWGYVTNDPVGGTTAYPNQALEEGLTFAFNEKLESFDDDFVLDVSVILGQSQLATTTDELVLNGANRAVIFHPSTSAATPHEILGFGTVTDQGGGVVRLGRLLRGLRGTESAVLASVARNGALVVFLDDFVTRKVFDVDSELLVTKYYRSQTDGETFETVIVEAFAPKGMELAPYPVDPVFVDVAASAARTGDVDVTWERRTRVGGEEDLEDGVTEIPLSEQSENYSVDLLVKTTNVVSITKTATDPDVGVTFTSAERVTAGYTAAELFKVVIYQISDVATSGTFGNGRGRRRFVSEGI